MILTLKHFYFWRHIMSGGTHAYKEDERNRDIKIYVNGDIVHRDDAKISVFDSGFLMGDGIWESFRFQNGKLAFVDQHLYRLRESAAALDMDLGMTNQEILDAIYKTLKANKMEINVHIRLVISSGRIRPYDLPKISPLGLDSFVRALSGHTQESL